MSSARRTVAPLVAVLVVALTAVPATAAAGPVATTAAKKCGKGLALLKKSGRSRCVKRCPSGYAKKRKAGKLVCVRKPATAIQGEEAKTVVRGLLVHQYFEGTQNTSGGGGSVSGREAYGFCNGRYGWASSSTSSTEFGGVTSDEVEGGSWSIDQAVADPGRRKAQGTLTLTPDGGKPARQIEVLIDLDGTDRLGGYDMENDNAGFDCSNAPGG